MRKTIRIDVTTETYLAMLKLAKAENLTLDAWLTEQAERAVEAMEVEQDVGMRPAGDESVTHVVTGIDKSGEM